MADLVWASVTDLARMIATKEVSPVEVVRALLQRIERLDGTLHAFITVCGDAALAAARAAASPRAPPRAERIGEARLVATGGAGAPGGARNFADGALDRNDTVTPPPTAAGATVVDKLNRHESAYTAEGHTSKHPSRG